MPEKKILAFDFGMKRIGVAFANTCMVSARALSTLQATDGIPTWDKINKLIADWEIDTLVVGIPTRIDGKKQHTTFAAKKFANRLKERFNLPVYLVDERLTTVEARRRAFEEGGYKKLKKTEIDSVAAVLILEQWLMTN